MAQCGYNFHESLKLPSWLYWKLAEAQKKRAAKERIAIYQAAGMAFGSFEKEAARETLNGWQETLKKGYVAIPTVAKYKKNAAMTKERKAAWMKLASMGGFG